MNSNLDFLTRSGAKPYGVDATRESALIQGDCLEVMDTLIKEGIKVDAIITDPPYGSTACKWDSVIPFNKHIMLPISKRSKKLKPIYRDKYILQELKAGRKYKEICEHFDTNSKEGMWDKLNKLIKPNGAIVLFGSEPFSSALRMSNIKNYKYDWKWEKSKATLFTLSKKRPLKSNEDIIIFHNKQPTYNPQMTEGKPYKGRNNIKNHKKLKGEWEIKQGSRSDNYGLRYPRTNIKIANENKKGQHPTQKPVALMEYLISTYTNENELVLDFTSGSGTTAVACENTNRRWICIEQEEKYCEIHKNRINGL